MNQMTKLGLAAALSGLVLPTAQALEFSGYLRGGLGGSTGSQSQRCFQLPGAASKYRLGNECEQLAEPALSHDFLTLDDGSTVGLYGMLQLYNEYDHAPIFDGDHGKVRLVQGYAYWKNVGALNGGSLWAGRRYYKRNAIDISDFFYWNQSATGGGIEDVQIGDLRYSYAFSRKDNFDQKRYINRHDFNVAGFKVNPGGELEVGLSYIDKPESIENSHSGWAATLQHKQQDFLGWGGVNTFAVQYGKGPGIGLGSTGDVGLDTDAASFRVVEFFDWQPTPTFGGQFQVVYQRDKDTDDESTAEARDWWSVGGRTVFGLAPQFKLATELGHDRVKAPGGTRTLTKFTIAPTWSPNGTTFRNANPEVRFYYTYAIWNRAAQEAANQFDPGSALSDTGSFGSSLHGSNFGVQIEHSW
ncbi:maltoporin [Pseudomonas indica]|uniref:maltoporin n=1 Tax=Pseudomonas indica TaxID=137658 RepID=UPI000BAB3387|nr:carbohydrate porin [Pseudomonas indica]MBU3055962.1 carbohydrate porin [Pseudomonas indica]PAU51471.1 maltoporin [Pseudomonas indica]